MYIFILYVLLHYMYLDYGATVHMLLDFFFHVLVTDFYSPGPPFKGSLCRIQPIESSSKRVLERTMVVGFP